MLMQGASFPRQRGAILAITAILLVVLIGIAALALDMGRVLVLRTEMHNAVDSAALAAAAELNGKDGARGRAMAAARNLLVHQGHHAKVAELLGDAMQAGEAPFRFFCAIGSPYDAGNACEGTVISDGGIDDGKILATSDLDAHYVRVTLESGDSYTVALFFMPVLSMVTGELKDEQDVYVTAVAGRHFSVCNYPPVMICDPFEAGASVAGVNNFREAVEQGYIEVGDTLTLKYQGPGAAWAPGNFAFLSPGVPGDYETGAPAVGKYLANPCSQPCTPPVVKTKPGAVESWPVWGINTFFEVYEHNQLTPGDYPPAPNIIEYPAPPAEPETAKSWDSSGRFFEGDWDWQGYRDLYHRTGPGSYDPGFADLSGMTRWEVYNREISSGYLPLNPSLSGPDGVAGTDDDLAAADVAAADAEEPICVRPDCTPPPPSYTDPWTCSSKARKVPGAEDCKKVEPSGSGTYPYNFFADGRPEASDLYFDGTEPKSCEAIRAGETPSTPNSIPERRRLFIAIIQCDAQIVHGATDPVAHTFAEFFVLQRARIDKVDNKKMDVLTEFMGLADEKEAEYHVDVQLYE